MVTQDANPQPASDPKPLHERWPQAFAYPLQMAALSTVVAIAVAHVVVRLIPGVVGWIFDLIVWAGFFKYAFEVLRWSANGRSEAPEISFTVSDELGRYAVLLLLLVEVALVLIAMWWGVLAALIVGIALMAAMPAMVTILALEEGMARALNPLVWLMIASRVGGHYFVLVGFFCAALIAQSMFAATIAAQIPWPVGPLLVWLFVDYLMIVNFHLIGSVIHEHRDELGYSGHLELQDEVPHTDKSRAILDAARARAAGGDVRGAVALLHDELAAHADLLPVHDEYRHWLRQDGDKTELAAHGKKVYSCTSGAEPGSPRDRRGARMPAARSRVRAGQGRGCHTPRQWRRRCRPDPDRARPARRIPQALPQPSRHRPQLPARGKTVGRAHEQGNASARDAQPDQGGVSRRSRDPAGRRLPRVSRQARRDARQDAAARRAVSRWRPPQAASTAIVTADGQRRLKAELDELWRVRRPEVVKALAAAAAEGDRSENAEYTYRKKQLGEIDRRVRYLSKRIPSLKIAQGEPADRTAIFFGAWFEIEDDDGNTCRYRIVGPDETDAGCGHISIDSPLARAALKKRIDDEFEAALPGGVRRFTVIAVSYFETGTVKSPPDASPSRPARRRAVRADRG